MGLFLTAFSLLEVRDAPYVLHGELEQLRLHVRRAHGRWHDPRRSFEVRHRLRHVPPRKWDSHCILFLQKVRVYFHTIYRTCGFNRLFIHRSKKVRSSPHGDAEYPGDDLILVGE